MEKFGALKSAVHREVIPYQRSGSTVFSVLVGKLNSPFFPTHQKYSAGNSSPACVSSVQLGDKVFKYS